MKRILVTGGAGYIGTVLIDSLLKRDDVEYVTCLDNLMYRQEGLFSFFSNPKFRFVKGDASDYNVLEKLVPNHNIVIPLAAIVGFPACAAEPNKARAINANQLEMIVDIAAWDTKIICPNSNSGYGVGAKDQFCTEETPLNPISVYGVTKCEGEKHVLKYGGISLRLATVFGTSYRFRRDLLVNDFVLRAKNDGFIVLFEAHFKRNFIHVRDVVKAFNHCVDNYDSMKGQAYNVGLSTANLSKLELCEKIKEQVPKFVIKTDDFTKDLDQRNYIVSNEKIERTGWMPDWTLEAGIKELLNAYKAFNSFGSQTQHTNL
jgi:nucleoside-diphosphate-sugar epimerase